MRLFVIMVLLSWDTTRASECQSDGTICINRNHFKQCVNIDGQYRLVGNETACPDGTICDHSSGTAICRKYGRSAPIAKLESEEAPPCPGPANHSASSCYQYYECQPVWWWFEPELKTCQDGLAFDINSTSCLDLASVDCQARATTTGVTTTTTATTTTTTPLPPVVVPECKESGKHRALNCYQYTQCVKVWWWWAPELKTCPKGQAFDDKTKNCVCAGLVHCELPDSLVTCEGPGTLPALTCRDYYECAPFLWWWEPKLKQCESGQVYDRSSCQCVAEETVPCLGPEPKCQGYGKYPALQKNQYYECVLNDLGLGWIPTLKTCSWGKVFLASRGKCVLGW